MQWKKCTGYFWGILFVYGVMFVWEWVRHGRIDYFAPIPGVMGYLIGTPILIAFKEWKQKPPKQLP
jgi:hypothetical protein